MKNKRNVLYSLIIMLAGVIYFPVQAQQKSGTQNTIEVKTYPLPFNSIVRSIKRDRKGSMWLVSNEGIIRYDEKSLTDKKPTVTEITNKSMIFGISEDDKGNIWFSASDGVYRYDGKTITDFAGEEGQQ